MPRGLVPGSTCFLPGRNGGEHRATFVLASGLFLLPTLPPLALCKLPSDGSSPVPLSTQPCSALPISLGRKDE